MYDCSARLIVINLIVTHWLNSSGTWRLISINRRAAIRSCPWWISPPLCFLHRSKVIPPLCQRLQVTERKQFCWAARRGSRRGKPLSQQQRRWRPSWRVSSQLWGGASASERSYATDSPGGWRARRNTGGGRRGLAAQAGWGPRRRTRPKIRGTPSTTPCLP